jgi:AhpD family alkylhydroperoxidase
VVNPTAYLIEAAEEGARERMLIAVGVAVLERCSDCG